MSFAAKLQAWCEQQPEIAALRALPRAQRRAAARLVASIIVGVPPLDQLGPSRAVRRAAVKTARREAGQLRARASRRLQRELAAKGRAPWRRKG